MTTFAEMGFASTVTPSSTNPSVDGYVGTLAGHPYHVHPAATPAQWTALEAAISSGQVTIAPYAVPSAPAPTLQGRLAELASERSKRESAGVMYAPGGAGAPVLMQTDAASLARIDDYVTQILAGAFPASGVSWKLAPGVFTTLLEADIYPLKRKVAAYVNACFANEAALSAALAANLQADITAGWPSNS